jgi:hypothetical protein
MHMAMHHLSVHVSLLNSNYFKLIIRHGWDTLSLSLLINFELLQNCGNAEFELCKLFVYLFCLSTKLRKIPLEVYFFAMYRCDYAFLHIHYRNDAL